MKLSLRTRVLVLLLLFLSQATISTLFVSRLAREFDEAGDRFRDTLRVYRLTRTLDAQIHAAAMAANDRLIAGAPPDQAARFRAADASARSLMRTLGEAELGDGAERELLVRLEETYEAIAGIASEILAFERPLGDPAAGALMERMDRSVDQASATLGSLLATMEARIDQSNALAARRSARLRTTALLSLAGLLGTSVLALVLLNAWILSPLAGMRRAIAAMQLGDYAPPPAPARRRLPNELAEVSERLQSKFLEIGRLAELTRAINEGRSLDEVLDLVYEKFTGLLPYDRIGLALVEDGGETITARWSRNRSGARMIGDGYSAPLATSSLAQVLAEGKPRILNDLAEYLRMKPSSEATSLIVREGMRSSLTCPLILKAAPIGVMFFSSRQLDAYRDAHVDLFLQIAGQLAAIIDKSRLHDELVRLNRLKNDFLGMAAHDLRNPAAAIGGYAEILLHDAPESAADQARMLERIAALAHELDTLLETLLDVAVIEAGTFTIAARAGGARHFPERGARAQPSGRREQGHPARGHRHPGRSRTVRPGAHPPGARQPDRQCRQVFATGLLRRGRRRGRRGIGRFLGAGRGAGHSGSRAVRPLPGLLADLDPSDRG